MNRHDTFLFLCDCLSFGPEARATADSLRGRLTRGGIRWEWLVEAASDYLLCPALYWALNRKRLLSCIPDDLRSYLSTMHQLNGDRNAHIMALAAEAVRHLNDVDVEPVLLKGTANLFTGIYPDPAIRVLCDVDLLVPREKVGDCVRRLRSAGYSPTMDPGLPVWKSMHHCVPLLKSGDCARIELHQDPTADCYGSILDAESVLRDSSPLAIGEARGRVPSAAHRIIHNVVHTQLQDQNYFMGAISLRQLFDLILMRDSLETGVDWSCMASKFEHGGCREVLPGYLLAGKRFFGSPLPPEVHPGVLARSYSWCVGAQTRLWAIRVGSALRIPAHFLRSLLSLIERPRVPKIHILQWSRTEARWVTETWARRW